MADEKFCTEQRDFVSKDEQAQTSEHQKNGLVLYKENFS